MDTMTDYNLSFVGYTELVQHAIDSINNYDSIDHACDFHHELFNTDYYIIGYYEAEQWLIKHVGIFNAIESIKQYEMDNFGEVTTDLGSSENVLNMLVYIVGEEILNESAALQDKWDEGLDKDDLNTIVDELKELIN